MFCADCFGDHHAAVTIGGAADANFGIPTLSFSDPQKAVIS